MTITERTLKEWRRQALQDLFSIKDNLMVGQTSHRREINERILKLTQELLDTHLINKSRIKEVKDDNRA